MKPIPKPKPEPNTQPNFSMVLSESDRLMLEALMKAREQNASQVVRLLIREGYTAQILSAMTMAVPAQP